MHEPLKNCPFCGGSPTTIERPDNIDGTQFFCAIACYCGRHSACAHKMAVRKTPEIAKADAIAAWNTRAPQPTQAQAGAVPPAVAGKPVAWLSTDCIGERYLCFTKPEDSDHARPLVFGDATPQPIQAQAGAVPLTPEQMDAALGSATSPAKHLLIAAVL